MLPFLSSVKREVFPDIKGWGKSIASLVAEFSFQSFDALLRQSGVRKRKKKDVSSLNHISFPSSANQLSLSQHVRTYKSNVLSSINSSEENGIDNFFIPTVKGQTSTGQGGGGTHGSTCRFLHPINSMISGVEKGVFCFFKNKIVKQVHCSALVQSYFTKRLYCVYSRKSNCKDNIIRIVPKMGRNPDF